MKYNAIDILIANNYELYQYRSEATGFLHYKLNMRDIDPESVRLGDHFTKSYYSVLEPGLVVSDPVSFSQEQRDFSANLKERIVDLFPNVQTRAEAMSDVSRLIDTNILRWSDELGLVEYLPSTEELNLPLITTELKRGIAAFEESNIQILIDLSDAYNAAPHLTAYICSPKFIPIFGVFFFFTYVHSHIWIAETVAFKVVLDESLNELYMRTYTRLERFGNFAHANPLYVKGPLVVGTLTTLYFAALGVAPPCVNACNMISIYGSVKYAECEAYFINAAIEMGISYGKKVIVDGVIAGIKNGSSALSDAIVKDTDERDSSGPSA